ncbi:cell wall-active antibiotics response protein [Deinococcus alpinitundrae]|uniref:cell wall-active antibiotics response protein n=1 Tax=Deinococcus alpinitundrae TaxID=468913 RepID=UPI00137B6C6F|nr:cell wall-active antibiotics response protein [Deinococcus alpinitundrae]
MSFVLVMVGGWYFIRPALFGAPSTETISLPLTASRAEIALSTSAGRLEVGPGSGGTLIAGTLGLNRNERLERQMATRSDTQVVQLTVRQTGANILLFGTLAQDTARWLVTLSPVVPLVLKVTTGVGDSALNLADLKVTDLRFEGGVGRATVRLPKTGIVSADMKSGVGQLNVTVPSGMKARVRVSTGLGTVKMLGDFQSDGEIYTSSGYAGASNRIDLRIRGGGGAVTVEQLGR